jgi:hypothetical protein
MGDYTQVFKVVWDDPAFRALDAAARLVFLYAWTSDRASIGGLHVASPRELMRAYTDDPNDDQPFWQSLDQLERKPLLLYDEPNEVVWVVNRAKYANVSPRSQRAIQREYQKVPDSPLKTRFARKYPWVKDEAAVTT